MIDLGIPEFADFEEIGRGGFGVVFRATEVAFARTVAIKVLTYADAETRWRFDRERLALGPVSNHPNIAQVFASGLTAGGSPYLAMEFMPGGSLEDLLKQSGPMPWPKAVEIGIKLAGALETAHRVGIMHRDLKPANVLLSAFGEPNLADFGIASIEGGEHTKSGVISASINFAPPEVLDGRRAGASGDVYSLGATIYALLSGRPPFARDGEDLLVALALRVATQPVPDLRPLGVPDELASVMERVLAKTPDDRYPTAEAFGRALQDVQRVGGLALTPLPLAQVPLAPSAGSTAAADQFGSTIRFEAPLTTAPPPPTYLAPPTPLMPPTYPPPPPPPMSPPPPPAPVADREGAPTPPPDRPARRRRRVAIGVAGVLLVVMIGVGVAVVTSTGSDDDEAATAPAEPGDETTVPPADDGASTSSGQTAAEWESLPPMILGRQQMNAVVTLQGKIWVAGGLDADAHATATVEYYEPILETWTQCDCDLPVALNHAMMTTYDDQPVILGGWVGVGDDIKAEASDRVLILRDLEWVELPPLLEPRIAGTAVTVGDQIIVTGGQDAAGELLATTEVFDGEAWQVAAPLPTPREHVAAATDGTHVYVVGGRLLPGGSAANLATLERYDPATDEWETLADMPTARGGLSAVWADGRLIALGGEGPTSVFDQVEAYDPTIDTWVSLPALPAGRHGLASAFFRRQVFAIGGALSASHLGSTGQVDGLAFDAG